MSQVVSLGGQKHVVPDDGTCPHKNLKSCVVNETWDAVRRSMSVIVVVGCKDCQASWTGNDYDCVKTQ